MSESLDAMPNLKINFPIAAFHMVLVFSSHRSIWVHVRFFASKEFQLLFLGIPVGLEFIFHLSFSNDRIQSRWNDILSTQIKIIKCLPKQSRHGKRMHAVAITTLKKKTAVRAPPHNSCRISSKKTNV
jgi:hypothetical protein